MSVRTYNPSVRVGNWNEDIQLEEVSFCYKFLTKVQVEYIWWFTLSTNEEKGQR